MSIFAKYEKSFSPEPNQEEEVDMGALRDLLRSKLRDDKIEHKNLSKEFQRRMREFAKGIM